MIETKVDVSKIVFAICMTVIVCVGMSTCSVDVTTIQECQASCKAGYSEMESATAFKCECKNVTITADPWVLPTPAARPPATIK